jgi:hypothetical protein
MPPRLARTLALTIAAIGLTCMGVAAMLATGGMPGMRAGGLFAAVSAVAVCAASVVAWGSRR